MKVTITYIRTLTLEETIEVATVQEAEQHAQARAWDTCELLDEDFDESDTQFTVEPSGDN